MNKYMQIAINEAEEGVEKGHGGPFGAVVVCNGEIIAKGHNEVPYANDPTAHAEINAIRRAARRLKTFDLSGCELYSTCEPCPMCLAAIHWAKIKKVYWGANRKDAAGIGFDDEYIYDVIKGTAEEQKVETEELERTACLKPMKRWEEKEDKIEY